MAKILVVDDDPSIRKLLNVLLSTEGHEIVEAADGVEACELFDADPSIELLVLDVMMPRMDGYGVLNEIRSRETHADVAILMLTAKGGKQDEARAMLAGADGYVTKPFDPDVLIGLIDVTLMYSPKQRAQARVDRRDDFLPEIGDQV